MSTRVRSFCKINLGLAVGPLRPDGFHALTTLYQTLALHDLVTVTARPARETSITLTADHPGVPRTERGDAEKNTAYRIVDLALRHTRPHRRGPPRHRQAPSRPGRPRCGLRERSRSINRTGERAQHLRARPPFGSSPARPRGAGRFRRPALPPRRHCARALAAAKRSIPFRICQLRPVLWPSRRSASPLPPRSVRSTPVRSQASPPNR